MRWNLLLLLLFGCGSPKVADVVFPVVAVRADGLVYGYTDLDSLTTTNRQALESYTGLRFIDSSGREYVVDDVKAIDAPGMLSDFAGTKRFRVEMTLSRGKRLEPSAAVAYLAQAVKANPGYLDLTEQGGEAVADEIASKATIAEVAELLAVKYEPGRVRAEAIERNNQRVEDLARRGE